MRRSTPRTWLSAEWWEASKTGPGDFLAGPNRQGSNPSPKEKVREMEAFLLPVPLAYDSPIPLLCLWRVQKLSQLRVQKCWLVRDGLIPLLWFFERFPKPERTTSALVIDSRWTAAIPPAWRSRCSQYELESRAQHRPAKDWVSSGLVSPLFCGPRTLRARFAQVRAKASLRCWLAVRPDTISPRHDLKSYQVFFSEINDRFGTNVSIVPWTDLLGAISFDAVEILDLNEGLLCADDAMIHFFLAKGAQLPVPRRRPRARRGKVLAISNAHGWRIAPLGRAWHSIWQEPEFLTLRGFCERTYRDLPSDVHPSEDTRAHPFPWPVWLTELGLATRDYLAVAG